MKYEDVDSLLLKTFPDFTIDIIDEGIPYCVAGNFARYLLEKYESGSHDTLVLAGDFIEKLFSYKNEKIDNLAVVGYLEGIQNVWSHSSTDAGEVIKFLGITSRKWWSRLNDFWSGNIYALKDNDC